MFKKVLIVEDHGITSSGLERTLSNLNIQNIATAQYCDIALLKIKAALKQDDPFQLLITDLSFKEDHRQRHLQSGVDLINEVKKIQPNLKILVYSVEHRIGKIKKLFEELEIDGFVGKERWDFNLIGKAIEKIQNGEVFQSIQLQQMFRNSKNMLELDNYDILLLKLLAKGMKQDQISQYFQEKNFPASSLRSIQDRLGKLKILFNAKTPTQLVATAIEKGFI